MRILSAKLLLSISFAGLLRLCAACSNIPVSNLSNTVPLPQPKNATSPKVNTTPRPFDPKLDIGVVIAGVDCSELLIHNRELKPEDELQVVLADDMPQEKLLAKVIGSNGCPPSPKSSIEEIVVSGDDTAPSRYEIRFEEGSDPHTGFGVVAANAKVRIVKGIAQLTASDTPKSLSFRVCSGHESFHMTVWNGKPLVGKRVWHSYMHLSYDTVPTCKSSEYR